MKKGQIFNSVRISLPKRNSFDLSHDRKFTATMGRLFPILCQEIYPNESWSIDGQGLTRTAPLVAPMMHQVNIYNHYFFTPYRILWANWDLFITGGDKFQPEAPVPVAPYVIIPEEGFEVGSIPDHLGFPTRQGGGTKVSALPFAAYLRVHQEYYRDENLQDTAIYMLQDGDNTDRLFNTYKLHGKPLARCWERDYFTSALPEPQKGPEVTIPLGTSAPIVYDGTGKTQIGRLAETGMPMADKEIGTDSFGNIDMTGEAEEFHLNVDLNDTHYVDLSAATSATVNSWRLAMAIQRFYERLGRGGSRTIEFLRNVWGSKASSSRLDRPEYIGGAKEPLSVSEVLQTSETSDTPLGTQGGHGISVTRLNGSHYHSSEYGVIIGLYSVMPKTAYSQGVPKAWRRLGDRFDYYFPDLAHIGEQPVKVSEIYHTSDEAKNEATFGYLPYGTELRYINDSIHGEFRSTQDFWTMGRFFEEVPALNADFVSADQVTRRVFADLSPDTDTLYVHMYHKIIAKRCIPLFGTPQ